MVSRYGVRTEVRKLLLENKLYTVGELANLVQTSEDKIRQMISVLKNPKYVEDPLDLTQTICVDRKKRWGLRSANEFYNPL